VKYFGKYILLQFIVVIVNDYFKTLRTHIVYKKNIYKIFLTILIKNNLHEPKFGVPTLYTRFCLWL